MNADVGTTYGESERKLKKETEGVRRTAQMLVVLGLVLTAAICVPAVLLADAVVDGSLRYPLVAAFMVVLLGPGFVLLGRMGVRQIEAMVQTMDTLADDLQAALVNAGEAASRRDNEARRQMFETRLANALEMAEGEPEVIDVVERALLGTVPDAPVELLLADNSHAHLVRAATASTVSDTRMCGVDSPDQCPAARRAQVQRFPDSDELDACPKLRGRETGRCSAICVPVSIMGRTVGVIHATSEPGHVFDESSVHGLSTVANLAGARIGLLRMVADTQLQAGTDSLTGLLNRRSLENKLAGVRKHHDTFAVVMADLDHFKVLNDTFGHDTGDRTLRLFAQRLAAVMRGEDLVCRLGGEEFAVVLPSCPSGSVANRLEDLRQDLAKAFTAAGLPGVTASFGVIDASAGDELVDALRRADVALFQAKRDGRDRVVVHDAGGQTVTSADAGESADAGGSAGAGEWSWERTDELAAYRTEVLLP